MQYIQLQQQLEGNIPNASISGSMNLFIRNGYINLKDETGVVLPQSGNAASGLQMELGWGSGTTTGVNGERVRLLNLNTNINNILTGNTGDEVWLFIERYKNTKLKLNPSSGTNFLNKSGWKHDAYPNNEYPNRPSEIKLTATTNNDFYFGQEEYFSISPTNAIAGISTITARGLGKRSNNSSSVYLRFKLKIGSDINGWIYSEPLAKIKLIWGYNNIGINRVPQLNYKYV